MASNRPKQPHYNLLLNAEYMRSELIWTTRTIGVGGFVRESIQYKTPAPVRDLHSPGLCNICWNCLDLVALEECNIPLPTLQNGNLERFWGKVNRKVSRLFLPASVRKDSTEAASPPSVQSIVELNKSLNPLRTFSRAFHYSDLDALINSGKTCPVCFSLFVGLSLFPTLTSYGLDPEVRMHIFEGKVAEIQVEEVDGQRTRDEDSGLAFRMPGYEFNQNHERGFFRFEIYIHPEGEGKMVSPDLSELEPLYRMSHIASEADDEDAIEFAKKSIRFCEQNHGLCCKWTPKLLPKRVVRIDGKRIFLHETKRETGQYVALSHVWGPGAKLFWRTTSSNINDRKQHIPLDELSSNFRDAIKLTKSLGISNIWIDTLCILQDDENDKACELPKMGSIYENAYLTISALISSRGDDGFLHPQLGRKKMQLLDGEEVVFESFIRQRIYHGPFEDFSQTPLQPEVLEQDWPLTTRAWTLQERVLSRRILHYGPEECIFECRAGTQCECGILRYESPTQSSLLTGYNLDSESVTNFRLWEELVSEYSTRNLSEVTDKLPAISSIASRFQSSQIGRYIAGLWERDLLRGLMWQSGNGKSFGRRTPALRYATYVAPTWSWASIQGPVYWNPPRDSYEISIQAEIEDVSCVTKTDNPFLEITSAHIKLHCHISKVTYNRWYQDSDDDFNEVEHTNSVMVYPPPRSGPRLERSRGLPLDRQQFNIDTEYDERLCDGKEVFLAVLWVERRSSNGLVLQKSGGWEGSEGVYRRIGTMSCTWDLNCGMERETITII